MNGLVPTTMVLLMAPLAAAMAAEPGEKPASTQEEAKPAPAHAPSPLDFHLQVRANTLAEGQHDAFLDDYRFESILVVPGVSGQLTPWFSYAVSGVGSAESFETAQVRVLDAVGMFKVADPLQIWVGRFVVPFDRFNLSGPFRNLIWNYPGFYGGVRRVGGENGPFGRDTGISVWGSVSQGLFKYHVMVHQLEDRTAGPRLTGRMSVSLLGREPGYFVSSSYLGQKDVLAFGVAMQYQHDGRKWTPAAPVGMPPPSADAPVSQEVDNLLAVTADLFAEKTFGSMGTATLDLAYYHYDEHRPHQRAYSITAAYIPPLRLGGGHTQLGLRWQQAFASRLQPQFSDVRSVDVAVSHFFSGYNLRLGLDYAHQWLGLDGVSNTVSVGLQYGLP